MRVMIRFRNGLYVQCFKENSVVRKNGSFFASTTATSNVLQKSRCVGKLLSVIEFLYADGKTTTVQRKDLTSKQKILHDLALAV